MVNQLLKNARTRLFAGCLVALCPSAAMSGAATAPTQADAPQGCDKDFHHPRELDGGPMGGPGAPDGHGPFGPDVGVRPPPYLRELTLTEEQLDKVFSIVHSAEPAMRDAGKAARTAREALRDAGTSAQYDANAVAALVQTQAKADSQMLLLHIQTEHDIYMLLTPEQRSKVAELKKAHEAHGHDGPPHQTKGG